MTTLNDRIQAALRISGWHPERAVDIEPWIAQLEKVGYCMNDQSRALLRTLGGLVIEPVLVDERAYLPTATILDPLRLLWLPRQKAWEGFLETSLSPLGEGLGDAALYISDDGRIFASWDRLFECLGCSVEDSLETLLFATKRGTRLTLP